MCNQNHEETKILVSERVLQRSNSEHDRDAMVCKISVMFKEHYQELTKCVKSVDSMIDVLVQDYPRPAIPCEDLRDAVECCYYCQEGHSLDCSEAVREFTECVREHLYRRVNPQR